MLPVSLRTGKREDCTSAKGTEWYGMYLRRVNLFDFTGIWASATVGCWEGRAEHFEFELVRYPTAGTSSLSEAQPFYVNSPYGLVLAHNGNLTNAQELRTMLDVEAHRHINTESDSEVLLNVFADQLSLTGKVRVNDHDVYKALTGTMRKVRGGYACTAMIAGFGMIGFRDPNGIRPLSIGKRLSKHGVDYMFASESVVLTSLGYTEVVDVLPGQFILFIHRRRDDDGVP